MKTAAVVQARVESIRLKGKVLAEVTGQPLLALMIERIRRCKTLDQIIVACPNTEENFPIATLAAELGVGCFRGSEEDVLSRVLGAARAFGVDVIVELTADCPLIDPAIVDRAVELYHYVSQVVCLDFVSTSRDSFKDPSMAFPRGMDTRVFSTSALSEVDRLTDDRADREHVSLYFWEHRNRFHCYDLPAPEELRSDVRLTVDTEQDLQLVRIIFETLYEANPAFDLAEILALLAVRPELREINRYVEQKSVR